MSQSIRRFAESGLCVGLLFSAFSGCTPTAESTAKNEDAGTAVEVSADAGASGDPQTSSAPLSLLSLPDEGLPPELVAAYEETRKKEQSAQRDLDLSMMSQQVAGMLLQDNGDVGHRFFVQSGKLLKGALEDGVQDFPAEAIGIIYFNQALGHAHGGETEASFGMLKEAVDNGFSIVDGLVGDPEFEEVRKLDGFEEIVSKAKENAAKYPSMPQVDFIAEAEKDMENSESFEFDLEATSLDGKRVSLSEKRGNVVIVDIWGTWCGPCRMEIPDFIQLQDDYRDQGFEMIGVNYEDSLETEEEKIKVIKDFAEEFGINYPLVLGEPQTRESVPGFRGYPTTLFVDKKGDVRAMAVGHRPYAYHEHIIKKLLAEPYEADGGEEGEEAPVVPSVPVPADVPAPSAEGDAGENSESQANTEEEPAATSSDEEGAEK